MSLTRAQLIMGDSGKGPLLPGQVQGVKEGAGVTIGLDGTITFNASTSTGVIKTNSTNAFNNYVWPASPSEGGQLTVSSSGTLSWVVRNPGFGLEVEGSAIKISLPFSTTGNAPSIGSDSDEAVTGSLYWNSESEQLFICNGNSWVPASYGPTDLNEALLTGTYTLYVNPQIGSDVYVTGVYDDTVTPVVTNQMAVAGYTPQKPFKTLQRAALEVARFQAGPQPDTLAYDRFIIKCSAGEHIIDGTPGSSSVGPWVSGTTPTEAQLRALNSNTYSGIILPRGVSVIGEDLRKTIIRPNYVPSKTGNIDTSRGSILRITGGGFFFNFTFKDKLGLASSHHLLDCFSFVSDTDLTNYYNKVRTVFAQSYPDLPVNPGETEIVAPKPPGTPEENTDGTLGSSPYIFNCSVRSGYGLCGINADGNDVTGFKSLVTAQFTGVSLQRDLYCWQKYNSSTKVWENTISNYNTYISQDPNNLRMDPTRRSYHIRAVNGAFIQEVSVFAIGQGIHHWVKNGGEISITNSNSSFGGCAALAEGYKSESFPQDTNWNVATINVATNMVDQTTIVTNVSIGVVDSGVANDATTIVLTQPLVESEIYLGIPQILASRKYTFKPDSYLWVENSTGPDWRAPLTSAAWDPSFPDRIQISTEMLNQDGDAPGQDDLTPNLAGNRVYIRRLTDNRTTSQRRYSLSITNTDSNVRNPPRDYVLQTTLGTGGGVVQQISDTYMTLVNQSGPIPISSCPVVRQSQIVLERSNPSNVWTTGNLYRPGDTVKNSNKHYTCVVQNSDLTFNPERWSESYVHMESSFNAYDYPLTIAPTIFFDNDTDGSQPTLTCGYDLETCWASPEIRAQYTTTTDYRGLHYFLIGIGFTSGQAYDILTPTTGAERQLDPSSAIDMKGYAPNGAANTLGNWPVEFRRPSVLRMFGHAWEWAGYLNYTKALPQYQGELAAQNQFNYYFTNSLGGRVYATGFNQEGYFVTAAGLTDLGTGSVTSVSDLGNPFSGVDIPTYYPYLKVDNLEVTTTTNFDESRITGSPTFDSSFYTNLRTATEADRGIIRLASTQEAQQLLSNNTAITPYNLSYAISSAIKSVVNLRLSLSGDTAVPDRDQINSPNIYIHPYNGSEIALYNTLEQSWQIVSFSGVLTRSLSAASSASTLYDVYLYNANAANPLLTPDLQIEFVAWSNIQTPPARSSQDGIIVRSGNSARRYVGVVRTGDVAGLSTIRLGGTILGSDSANYPRVSLANAYNLYDASLRYFFGNSWNVPTTPWDPSNNNGWKVAPASVYSTPPHVGVTLASPLLTTLYLDIYSNSVPEGVIVYVAPGIGSVSGSTPTGPFDDAFFGESMAYNQTSNSNWSRCLPQGYHRLYYMYRQQDGSNIVNEHPGHGMIANCKV